MTIAARLQSPLAQFDLAARAAIPVANAGVTATEYAFFGHLNLRGDPGDARFIGAVSKVIGVPLPLTPNTAVDAQAATIYWLGPDEWLIVCAGARTADLERELREALTGVRSSVTDVSGGQTIVVLRGPSVRETLAKGCPLDLHPRAFAGGQCAQSHLAKAAILLRPIGGNAEEGEAMELIFRRSFADYVWTWLEGAAAEYGFAVK